MENLTIADVTPNGQRLQMQFYPDNMTSDRSATIVAIEGINQNDLKNQWTGGNETLSFEVGFYAQTEGTDEAWRKARWLQSLTRKDANGKTPRLLVIFGDMYDGFVFILEQATATASLFKQNINNRLPTVVRVSLKLRVDGRDNNQNREKFRL